MEEDGFLERRIRAEARARARLLPARRLGVGYLGPARPDADGDGGWRGIVVATDGARVYELLVVAPGASAGAEPDEDALADAVEQLVPDARADPLDELRLAAQRGPGLVLEGEPADGLAPIFRR